MVEAVLAVALVAVAVVTAAVVETEEMAAVVVVQRSLVSTLIHIPSPERVILREVHVLESVRQQAPLAVESVRQLAENAEMLLTDS